MKKEYLWVAVALMGGVALYYEINKSINNAAVIGGQAAGVSAAQTALGNIGAIGTQIVSVFDKLTGTPNAINAPVTVATALPVAPPAVP